MKLSTAFAKAGVGAFELRRKGNNESEVIKADSYGTTGGVTHFYRAGRTVFSILTSHVAYIKEA